MRTQLLSLSCLIACLSLAACDDAVGPSGTLPQGSLTLEYEGAVAGTFQASGALELEDGRSQGGSFAAAGENHLFPGQKLTLVAFSPAPAQEPSLLALTLPSVQAPASIEIDANCQSATACARALLFFGVGPDRPHEDLDPKSEHLTCELESGTVEVESVSADRVRGTFSGSGFCVFDPRTSPLQAFRVESAAFDVPIWWEYRPALELH